MTVLEGLQIGQRFELRLDMRVSEDNLHTAINEIYYTAVDGHYLGDPWPDFVDGSVRRIRKDLVDTDKWMTKEGTLIKRISKYIKDNWHTKIPPDVQARVGEGIRRRMVEDTIVYGDTTNVFDWHSGDFGDRGSCFWGDNAGAKDLICDNGGFAIRLYMDDTYETGRARCWCIPQDNVFYVFNAYPKTQRIELFANILTQLLGLDYTNRKVDLCNYGSTGGLLYLNSGMGYAVHHNSIDPGYEHDFEIDEDDYQGDTCYMCGCHVFDSDSYSDPSGNTICLSCYENNYTSCSRCGEVYSNDDVHQMHGGKYGGDWLCEYCTKEAGYHECYSCEEWHRDTIVAYDEEHYCEECYSENFVTCEECGEEIHTEYAKLFHDYYYCEECYPDVIKGYCVQCERKDVIDQDGPRFEIDGKEVCRACYQEYAARRDGYKQEVIV